MRRRRSADRHPPLARARLESELLDTVRPLHLGQRMMVRPQHVEEIVANAQIAHRGGAGEVHRERHGLHVAARDLDEPLGWLASPPAVVEVDLVLEVPDEPFAAVETTGPGADQLLGHDGREIGRRERQAVADRIAAHGDPGIARASPGMGVGTGRSCHRRERGQPDQGTGTSSAQ